MKDDSISYLDTCAQRFKDTTTWEWHDSIRYVKSQPISQHTCHTKIYCVKQRSFFVLILQQHSNVCRRSQHGSTRLWNIRHQVLWKSCCKYARLLISIDCFFYFFFIFWIAFRSCFRVRAIPLSSCPQATLVDIDVYFGSLKGEMRFHFHISCTKPLYSVSELNDTTLIDHSAHKH